MKYMGSKRRMLRDGLGDLIVECAQYASRIVDLFCGASSVAWYAAQNTVLPVIAVDLQTYAIVLARAVVARDIPLDPEQLNEKWLSKVGYARSQSRLFRAAVALEKHSQDTSKLVREARALCQKAPSGVGPVWGAYGGYYFSPSQALTFDYMLRHLPVSDPERSACLAATISAASRCAAAPGHTAQPFRPTSTASPFICEAWDRDPVRYCQKALEEICPQYARAKGEALVADAVEFAANLGPSDLAIVDPPYSGVQYSRFYHVLETIARRHCGPVSGAGRYPSIAERPQSDFSRKRQSKTALEKLLTVLSKARATVIFTFPSGECSNGLSGKIVTGLAQAWFDVEEWLVGGQFSTLGGNNNCRVSRKPSSELLLVMQPKGSTRGG
jgi:adenine-specific DNA-methyltransferase